MYLIVALFLIFQIDNVYPETTDTRRPDAKQIIENLEDLQNGLAETTDQALGQTEDRGLREKIYKTFEKIFECTNEVIRRLRSSMD